MRTFMKHFPLRVCRRFFPCPALRRCWSPRLRCSCAAGGHSSSSRPCALWRSSRLGKGWERGCYCCTCCGSLLRAQHEQEHTVRQTGTYLCIRACVLPAVLLLCAQMPRSVFIVSTLQLLHLIEAKKSSLNAVVLEIVNEGESWVGFRCGNTMLFFPACYATEHTRLCVLCALWFSEIATLLGGKTAEDLKAELASLAKGTAAFPVPCLLRPMYQLDLLPRFHSHFATSTRH